MAVPIASRNLARCGTRTGHELGHSVRLNVGLGAAREGVRALAWTRSDL